MDAVWALVEEMVARGSSFSLTWGEDTGRWECAWLTGGARHTATSDTARQAIVEVWAQATGERLMTVGRDDTPTGG
jgi:hypothetical protein